MNKDTDILQAAATLELVTIDDLAIYLGRNKKSLERRLPKLVSSKLLYRNRWASTEPFIYSPKDLSRRSPFTIAHELLLTSIHTTLYRTGLLIDWRQGKEDWRGSVHQDAFCMLERGKRYDYFIEADNGTMNSKDMEAKIRVYLIHFQENPIPFKVLFVTTSQARAKNLSRLAESTVSEKKRKLYLFTTIDKFKTDPLGPVCFIPYEDQPHSILP
jgi:Replication-relaxation